MMLELNKLYHMDCMEGMKKMPDNSIDLMLTDMPYNMTNCKWDIRINLTELWNEWLRIVKDSGTFVFTASQPFTTDLINSKRAFFRYELIWNKIRPTGVLNAKYRPMKIHENILIFYKKTNTYNPILRKKRKQDIRDNKRIYKQTNNGVYGDTLKESQLNEFRTIPVYMKYPDSILNINRVGSFGNEKTGHPTQKPIHLFRYLIKTYSNKGDTVYDGFMGSGTTAIACEIEERDWIGFEIDEDYHKAATERIERHKQQLKLF